MVKDSRAPLDEIFHALASETRRSILSQLTASDLTVGELAEPHDMSLAAVSKNIDVLERAGLVTRVKQGRRTNCHLNPEALTEASSILNYYRSFWGDQLDALQSYLRSKGNTVDTPD